MKLSRHTLKRLEKLISEQGYSLIYEKGSFDSSHCLVHEKKYAVINKFLEIEQRILILAKILEEITPDLKLWTQQDQKWYDQFLSSYRSDVHA